MKTKIVTIHFDYPGKENYRHLLNAFRESVYKNMPDSELDIIEITPPERNSKNARAWSDNTVKIRKWIESLSIDRNIIFADCDMIVTGDLSTAFEEFEFDIAYTKRSPRSKHPLNGGMIFVRATEKAHEFIKLWTQINEKMYRDKHFHKSYQPKYGGINQSALGYLLESGNYDANVIDLPCSIYNACDDDWHKLSDEVKAIHYKGALRNDVITRNQIRFPKAIDIWDEYSNIGKMAEIAHKGKIEDRKNEDPETFTQKLYYRKLYDKNPALNLYSDIHKSREFVVEKMSDLPIVPLFNDIPGGGLEYIVRRNGVRSLNMYITLERRIPRMNIRKTIEKWLKMNIGPQSWGEAQIENKGIYIERILRNSDGSLPDTIAIDVFHGKPEFITVSQFMIQTKPKLIEKKVHLPNDIDSDLLKKSCEIAKKLCSDIDFMRVEFLAFDEELIFHRFTPYPEVSDIDDNLDIEMGKKWNLTKKEDGIKL